MRLPGRRRRPRPDRTQRPGARSEPAPFIVASPGSGTTLLRLMLDAHPDLAIPPETHFVPDLIAEVRRERRQTGELPSADRLAELFESQRRWDDFQLDAAELRERLRALPKTNARQALRAFYGLYAESQGKPRWGDKTPEYVIAMRRISRALPEARFVHLIRDGRDVALSRIRWRAERGRKPRKPRFWAKRWARWIGRARVQAETLPHYLEVRYERLVLDPEPELRRICDFVELPWDDAVLSHHEGAAARLTELDRPLPSDEGKAYLPASHRVRKHELATRTPQAMRVEAWRREMSAADREVFERVAGELLAELGYETLGRDAKRPSPAGEPR